jgi:ankyrin repeat protein
MIMTRMRWSVLLAAVMLLAGLAGAQDIFEAVKADDLAKVQAMVAKDPSLVRSKDASGNTPLHAAAIAGSVPMADWLLSKGGDINAGNLASATPLFEAIRNKKDDVALLLIDKGADIGKNGGALVQAANKNRLAVAERLIAKGADIEQKQGEYTPLGYIARGGVKSFEVFELLMEKGAQFNLRDSLGHTPLDNAVFYAEDDRIIDLLLDRSAEVTADPDSLKEIMSIAARRGNPRLFDYYRTRGGEALFADEANRRRFMRGAILGGSLNLVKKLRERQIPLDFSVNAAGMTPLHWLSSNPEALGMIEFLAANGADLNVRTKDGRSAYNIAQARGNEGAAALLAKLGANTEPQKFPILTGPYVGQTPGDELQMFAPGIINDQDHGTIAFSPDGQEVYWPTGKAIKMMKVRDGRWTEPAYAPFSGPRDIDFYDDVPYVTPDNKRLFFMSKRPLGSEVSQKENIWYVERTADGWSEPKPLDAVVNGMRQHWQITVSNSGNLYFGSQRENDTQGGGDLYCSRLVDGRYTEPVNLGPAVNTKDHELQPFIAPDESFILFWRSAGQVPSAFVSFKGRNGEWLPAVKFDLPWSPGGIMISPDGKYLFAAGRWKSAKFLEDLRPKSEHP